MSTINNRSAVRRPRRPVPAAATDLPPIEALRIRTVLGRVRSPALARVIACLAYGPVGKVSE